MGANRRPASQCAITLLVIGCCLEACAQSPLPPAGNGILEERSKADQVEFSIDDGKTINRYRRWQEIAVLECRRILKQRLDGKLDDPGGWQAVRAVNLLATLRVSEQDVTDLLCGNLTLVPEVVGGSVHWTDAFVSAMALIQIGGPPVATAVINHLKQPRSETELLLCAQILHKNDAHDITLARFRLATEKAKLELTPESNKVFVQNLTQIKEWLSDPQFGKDARYSPLKLERADD